MGKIVREFATHWENDEYLWFERDEDDLLGTQRSGGCPLPRVRICDLAAGPTNRPGYRPPVLWSGEDGIIEMHHIDAAEDYFHRSSDYDVMIFQFAGNAGVESEFGEFKLQPGHVMHIPSGAAYRIIGNPQSRQMIVKLREPFETAVDPNKPLTETVFDVRPQGSNLTPEGVTFPERKGKILEMTEFWDRQTDPIVIERDHARLVGCAIDRSTRKITVIRAFDYFCGITGKGGIRAPELFKGKNFKVDVYNTTGQQHGFHRGCDGEEIWFQFRGHGINDTEWGQHELDAGEIGYVPRGIAHRITGDDNFLRFNLYFRRLMKPNADASSHHGETHYEVKAASYKELPSYAETKKRIDDAIARGERPRM